MFNLIIYISIICILQACASFLIEYHLSCGYQNESDLFVAQAVFQFLCYKNKPTACVVFYEYTQKHPNIHSVDGPPFVLPLLNFLWLLLLCIETGKVSFYSILVEKYQPCLQRDPSYSQYLDKIGQIFFGLPPPASNKKKNIFDSLFKNLLSDDVDDPNENLELPTTSVNLQSSNAKAATSSVVNGEVMEDDTLD